MKSSLSIFLLWIFIVLILPPTLQAQDYVRARIYCPHYLRPVLQQTGAALDHPIENTKNYITGDISVHELNLIKKAGFTTEILIPDIQAWYLEQMKNESSSSESAKTSSTQAIPSGFNLGSMGGYLTYTEVLLELDSMLQSYPNLISIPDTIGYSIEGRPILAFKISDFPNIDENEPEVLYTALHHAREPNSMMQMIYYMQYLLSGYGTDPEVTCLVNEREMYFIPVLNPDGYVYNEMTNPMGGGMWRKNRRNNLDGTYGVDLNRNYANNWAYDDYGSSPNTSAETYRGTGPFSEPETQAIQNFCNSRQFKLTLNYHTISNLLIYPYGYIPYLQTPDSAIYKKYATLLTEENNYLFGTGVETVGYVTNGDSDDWMYSEQTTKGKIFSMTPEVGDPQEGFWPPQSRIVYYCQINIKANLINAWLAGEYVSTETALLTPVTTTSLSLPLKVINHGLESASNIQVTLEIIDPYILSVSNTIQISNLPSLSSALDSFQLTLASGIAEGTLIRAVAHSQYIHCFQKPDTISFYYGTPQLVFTTDFENGQGNWINSAGGNWALTTEDSYSPVHSMTDSPNAEYLENTNSNITYSNEIDLSLYASPRAEFYARWRIEKNFDYVQFKVSANNGPYIALKSNRTRLGSMYQATGEPVFDGYEPWDKEVVDLSAYAGKKVKFRFTFTSDTYLNDEGFYFDDFVILGYDVGTSVRNHTTEKFNIQPIPNPAGKSIQFFLPESLQQGNNYSVHVMDLTGKIIEKFPLIHAHSQSIEYLLPGVYIYTIFQDGQSVFSGKLIKSKH